jgi:hypothetical protein
MNRRRGHTWCMSEHHDRAASELEAGSLSALLALAMKSLTL